MLSSKYRKLAKSLKGQRNAKKDAVDISNSSSVMYIGHLPHGFYEKEIKGYFSQFGVIKAIRVSRSKRTAQSRGYAFVRFDDAEVAEIAAKAMNGYHMFSQKLVCRVVPPDKLHADTLKHANRQWRTIDWHHQNQLQANRKRVPADSVKRNMKALVRDAARQAKLAALGIDYDYPSLGDKVSIDPTEAKRIWKEATAVAKEQRRLAHKERKQARQSQQRGDDATPKAGVGGTGDDGIQANGLGTTGLPKGKQSPMQGDQKQVDVHVDDIEKKLRELEGQIEAHVLQAIIAREDGNHEVARAAAGQARELQEQAEQLSSQLEAAGLIEGESDGEEDDPEAGNSDSSDEEEVADDDGGAQIDPEDDEDELLVTSGDAFVPAWSEFAQDMEDLQVQVEVAGAGHSNDGAGPPAGSEGMGPLGVGDLAQLKQLVSLARAAREEEEKTMASGGGGDRLGAKVGSKQKPGGRKGGKKAGKAGQS